MRPQTLFAWCTAGIVATSLLMAPLCKGQGTTSPSPSSFPQHPTRLPLEVSTILERSETFTLYSLDPMPKNEKKNMERFQGWLVLGKSRIKTGATRKKLITALKKGIAESDGDIAKCFEPRHGIRATYKGKTADLAICFACSQIEIYHNNRALRPAIPITRSPEATFNRALKDAKLPLARDRKEPSAPKN